MTITIRALVLISIVLFSVAHAHQDTALKYDNKVISGLPKQYSPATYDKAKQRLVIASKILDFPYIIKEKLTYHDGDPFANSEFKDRKPKPYNYLFKASWYHEIYEGGLPPYLVMLVSMPGKKASLEFLIDLDSLKILTATLYLDKGNGELYDGYPIDLDHTEPWYPSIIKK